MITSTGINEKLSPISNTYKNQNLLITYYYLKKINQQFSETKFKLNISISRTFSLKKKKIELRLNTSAVMRLINRDM